MLKMLPVLAGLLLSAPAFAQTAAPAIQFSKLFGGTKQEDGSEIIQTRDKGYLVAGNTMSNDGQVKGFHTGTSGSLGDGWIVKTDASGNIMWTKCIGGSENDPITCLGESADAYLIGGYTWSKNGDFTGFPSITQNGYIAWLDKGTGNIKRVKPYSGDWHGELWDLKVIDDKYIIITGANAMKKNKDGVYSARDVSVAKLDINGTILWEKYYGGLSDDWGYCITPKSKVNDVDRGYMLAAYVMSSDGDIQNFKGGADAWIASLDSAGNLIWSKTYGGANADRPHDIKETGKHEVEGGVFVSTYMVLGFTNSTNGDITDAKGAYDYWAFKFDDNRTLLWSKTYGGSNEDWECGQAFTEDGGGIMAGWTKSTDGIASTNHTIFDQLLVRIDKDGNLVWSKTLGSTVGDFGGNVTVTCDKGYAFTMTASQGDGDVNATEHGGGDMWLCKLKPDGLDNIDCSTWPSDVKMVLTQADITISPVPATGNVTITLGRPIPDAQLLLTDAMGKVIAQRSFVGITSMKIDVSSYARGVYFAYIKAGDQSVTKKLIVQ